jgi:predicted nucleic acid-binding protein
VKKVFLDTNIVLDLLGFREPFYEHAAKIATLADQGKIQLFASALSFATANYILAKYYNKDIAIDKLRKLKVFTTICAIDEEVIEKGLNSEFKDFEDALQYFSALKMSCNYIITRNSKDFKDAEIPVMTAKEFLASIKNK